MDNKKKKKKIKKHVQVGKHRAEREIAALLFGNFVKSSRGRKKKKKREGQAPSPKPALPFFSARSLFAGSCGACSRVGSPHPS
jgi:hypothetical protein